MKAMTVLRVTTIGTFVLWALLTLALFAVGGCNDKPVAVSLFGDSTSVGLSKDVNLNDGPGAPSIEPATASSRGEGVMRADRDSADSEVPLRTARNMAGDNGTTSNQGNRAVYNVHYATESSFEKLSRLMSKEGGGAIGIESPIATGDNANQETGGQDVDDSGDAGDTDQGEGQ